MIRMKKNNVSQKFFGVVMLIVIISVLVLSAINAEQIEIFARETFGFMSFAYVASAMLFTVGWLGAFAFIVGYNLNVWEI